MHASLSVQNKRFSSCIKSALMLTDLELLFILHVLNYLYLDGISLSGYTLKIEVKYWLKTDFKKLSFFPCNSAFVCLQKLWLVSWATVTDRQVYLPIFKGRSTYSFFHVLLKCLVFSKPLLQPELIIWGVCYVLYLYTVSPLLPCNIFEGRNNILCFSLSYPATPIARTMSDM